MPSGRLCIAIGCVGAIWFKGQGHNCEHCIYKITRHFLVIMCSSILLISFMIGPCNILNLEYRCVSVVKHIFTCRCQYYDENFGTKMYIVVVYIYLVEGKHSSHERIRNINYSKYRIRRDFTFVKSHFHL